MIVETTSCARENVRSVEPRRRDGLKGLQAGVRPAEITRGGMHDDGNPTKGSQERCRVVGGMAGILATGRAPAFAQGTTVHWLRWNDFVPASDQLLRKELLPAAGESAGNQDQSRDGER